MADAPDRRKVIEVAIPLRFIEVKDRRLDAHTVCVSQRVADRDQQAGRRAIAGRFRGNPESSATSVNLGIKKLQAAVT